MRSNETLDSFSVILSQIAVSLADMLVVFFKYSELNKSILPRLNW